MVTKYLVELEDGDRLQVVRQNLETTSSHALEMRGRTVRVAWRSVQTSAIGTDDPEEGSGQ
jgi:hypothetical protein